MQNSVELSGYRQLLIQRLAELTALEQQSLRSGNVELDQNKVGRLSRMDALQQQAVQDEILARAKHERVKLHLALVRIERNNYGWCKECGGLIGDGRLQFDPTIELCIQCAQNEEH